jgi:hypothetical protein
MPVNEKIVIYAKNPQEWFFVKKKPQKKRQIFEANKSSKYRTLHLYRWLTRIRALST